MSKFFHFLPNDTIVALSRLKALADDLCNVTQNITLVLENIMGKGENASYQHFLLLPYFQKAFSSGTSKVIIVWKRVKHAINPLPHMPILGSSNSAASKNMMSKLWTDGVQISD